MCLYIYMNCDLIPYHTKRELVYRKKRKTPHFNASTCELHGVRKGNDGNYYKIVKTGLIKSNKKWKKCGPTEYSCKSVCSQNYTYNRNKCNKNNSKKNSILGKMKKSIKKKFKKAKFINIAQELYKDKLNGLELEREDADYIRKNNIVKKYIASHLSSKKNKINHGDLIFIGSTEENGPERGFKYVNLEKKKGKYVKPDLFEQADVLLDADYEYMKKKDKIALIEEWSKDNYSKDTNYKSASKKIVELLE